MKKVTTFNKIIIVITLLGSIYYSFVCITGGDIYRLLITLTVIPVVLLPYLLQKIGNIKIPDTLETVYMIFIFFAYLLGSIVGIYNTVAHYDTIIHFFSGIVTAAFAYYVYMMLTKEKPRNITTVILFVLGTVSLIAITWEVFEFVSDIISGKDAQHVLDTGVNDTMIDMIVALGGAILFSLDYFIETKCKKNGIMKKYIKEVEECYDGSGRNKQ